MLATWCAPIPKTRPSDPNGSKFGRVNACSVGVAYTACKYRHILWPGNGRTCWNWTVVGLICFASASSANRRDVNALRLSSLQSSSLAGKLLLISFHCMHSSIDVIPLVCQTDNDLWSRGRTLGWGSCRVKAILGRHQSGVVLSLCLNNGNVEWT